MIFVCFVLFWFVVLEAKIGLGIEKEGVKRGRGDYVPTFGIFF